MLLKPKPQKKYQKITDTLFSFRLTHQSLIFIYINIISYKYKLDTITL